MFSGYFNFKTNAVHRFTRLETNLSLYIQNLRDWESQAKDFVEEQKEEQQGVEDKPTFSVPKGIYLYGPSGGGKTMIMDLFQNQVTAIDHLVTKRMYFYDFMTDLHLTIHEEKKKTEEKLSQTEIIEKIASDLVGNCHLLCFDEFFLEDLHSSVLFQTFFKTLLNQGVVIILTSNFHFNSLFENKHNSQYLRQLKSDLEQYFIHVPLSPELDYRTLETEKKPFGIYFDSSKQKDFNEMLKEDKFEERTVALAFGRALEVRCFKQKVLFDFKEIFSDKEPILGSSDFQLLCEEFDIFLIKDIPQLGYVTNKNETRRFISFIDILYDRSKTIMLSSSVSLENLILSKESDESCLKTDEDFNTLSKRMLSRLNEMIDS